MQNKIITFYLIITLAGVSYSNAQNPPYPLKKINEEGIVSLLPIDSATSFNWENKREEIKKNWLEFLKGIPERPKVHYRIIGEKQFSNYVRKTIKFNTVYGDSVSAILLVPITTKETYEKLPAVLALQPTNERGKLPVSTPILERNKNQHYGLDLVLKGYVVLAPDDLTSGDRIYPGKSEFESAPFYKEYPNWTIMAKTIVDHQQALDVLVSLEYVNKESIGVIGLSFGGYNSYFLSSIDSRVSAIVSICGLGAFKGDPRPYSRWGRRQYTHFPNMDRYQKEKKVPFGFNEIIALSAPRPMFFYLALNDKIFPQWKGNIDVLDDVYKLYKFMGKSNNFEYYITPGEHGFPSRIKELAYDFLDSHLKS